MTNNATVTFIAIDPDPNTSTITAAPTSIVSDGSSTSTITVQLKDADGYNITTGGDTVALFTTAGTLSAVTDSGDGTYTAALTSSTAVETATITGTLNSVPMSDDATVTFTSLVQSVHVTPADPVLAAIDETVQLFAEARDASNDPIGDITTFQWSSDDTGVASVDTNTGLVTAVSNGIATIEATVQGVTGSTQVQVAQQGTKLAFSYQPSSVYVGQSIAPAVQVGVQDSLGHKVPGATDSVTLALLNNPSGATLSGTLARQVVDGTAEFDDLQVDKAGTGYTLEATGASLTPATSAAFDVTLEPMANAGGDVDVNTGGQVILDGSGSLGSNLTYAWTQVSGPSVGPVDAVDQPEFTAPDTVSTLEFDLVVSDGTTPSAADRVVVWVLESTANHYWVDSTSGNDGNPGTRASPLATLDEAITRADAAGQGGDVYVAEGSYPESVTLAASVSIYGGFNSGSWLRDVESYTTNIDGGATAVSGVGAGSLTLDGLTINAANGAGDGGSSIGIKLVSSLGVVVSRSTVRAGLGVAGAPVGTVSTGAHGMDGSTGDIGGETACPAGGDGGEWDFVPFIRWGGPGGSGGASGSSPATGSAGIDGGPCTAICGGYPITCSCQGFWWAGGSGGEGGPGGVGVGGQDLGDGGDGDPGLDGNNGQDGSGAGDFGALDAAGNYFVSDGTTGSNGAYGYGGGGGGGGGTSAGLSTICGSSGGGGGSGGHGGDGGLGGNGGGGSFGTVLVDGSTATIVSSTVETAGGGSGGAGGSGKGGGTGGSGAIGGSDGIVWVMPGPQPVYYGKGGRGGDGGDGGDGGHGGGGGGGPSIGVLEDATSTVTLTNITYTLGAAGPGGDGYGTAPDGAAGRREQNYKVP
jgi:hypothetical protein